MSYDLDFHPYVRLALYHTWLRDYYLERSIYDHEIIFIDSGELSLEIGGRTYIAKAGDVCFIPPDTPHVISWHKENCNQPHVHFDFEKDKLSPIIPVSKKAKSLMSETELTYFRENYLAKRGIHLPYVYHSKAQDKIRTLMLELIREFTFRDKDPVASLTLEATLKSLLALILGENLGYAVDQEKTDLLSMVTQYLYENLRTNLSLRDLEMQFEKSAWSINKMFKETYGVSTKKYYDSIRLPYAKNLLLHSFKSVKEIAFSMGFEEPQTFSRWFKNLAGLYPTEYQNMKAAQRNCYQNNDNSSD